MTDLGDALAVRTAALVNVASVSRDEAAMAELVHRFLEGIAGLEVVRIGENVIARTTGDNPVRLLLGGHLDTVPTADNTLGLLEGDRVIGLGSADMKGGLAVMMELASSTRHRKVETTYVFYAREEIARTESGLLEIERERPELLAADAAVLLEPTGATVEAGCQGSLRLRITTRGIRAHSARPWVGINAIHRLGAVLELLGSFPERRPVIEGCEYRETLQAVGIEGGVAGNVIPDEASVLVNHRFAPDRDAEAAIASVRELFGPVLDQAAGERLEVLDAAPSAPPGLDHYLLDALVRASGREVRAKLAWTDVAFFSERGIPAANFGPGDPLVAHTAGEFVERGELEAVHDALDVLLGGAEGGPNRN